MPRKGTSILASVLMLSFIWMNAFSQSAVFTGNAIAIQQGGTLLGAAMVINCSTNVTCSVSGDIATVTANGGGGAGYDTIQANGTPLAQEPILNIINGTNTTVSCTDDPVNTRTTCTVNASGGGSGKTLGSVIVQSQSPIQAAVIILPISVTSGHMIVVGFTWGTATAPVDGTCVDTLSTPFTIAASIENTVASQWNAVWSGVASSSGPDTITCTIAGTTQPWISYAEVTGYSTVDAFGTSANTRVASVTTISATDFIYGTLGQIASAPVSVASLPLESMGSGNGNDGMAVGAYLSGAAGVYWAPFTSNDTGPMTVVVAFK